MDQNAEKNEKLESSYDENPYISKTYYHTQPEKLKSNLRLLDFISSRNWLFIWWKYNSFCN